jgi:glycosyltransferase involved in cell wall biosynthesis
LRVCLVYDCLFPYTIGGAERWYRNLAERLAAAGHDVTYLTLRQWPRAEPPEIGGVRVIAVGPQLELYAEGRRRLLPPLVFGASVLRHLARHGRRYDVVHMASFPYFSVLAAGLARRRGRFRLIVDWHEVWTKDYWREYLGAAGTLGWLVQRLCIRVPQQAFCFSRLHEARLRAEGLRGPVQVLEGEFAGSLERPTPVEAEPTVVFAGRHIPEKRVLAIPAAVAAARDRIPGLRAHIFGDGPDRPSLLRLIQQLGLEDVIEAPGFVEHERVDAALRQALCLLLPSQREGYGLVVVEAASKATPSVVVAGADNAATELISEGRNGYIAASPDAQELGEAIARVDEDGFALRERTANWFAENASRLSLASSLEKVLESYRR